MPVLDLDRNPNILLRAEGVSFSYGNDPVLRKGLNVVAGKVVYPGVAEAFKLPLVDVADVV